MKKIILVFLLMFTVLGVSKAAMTYIIDVSHNDELFIIDG